MDRPKQKKRSLKKAYFTAGIVFLLAITGYWILSDTSSSRMDKEKIQIKTVRKGSFNVYVVGNGTVISSNIDYIIPKVEGELVAVNVKSGDFVEKGQALFLIENNEVMAEYDNQKIALVEAKAALVAKGFELETQKLQLEKILLDSQTAHKMQAVEFEAYKSLLEKPNSPISQVLFRQSKIRESQLKLIYDLEVTRSSNFKASMDTQLNQYKSRVELADNVLARMRERVESLSLKAKTSGVIQDVDLRPGQRVEVGTVVGLISNPDEVYVRLKVPATQGRRLRLGQEAEILVSNEEKTGKVVRIDPNVKGTTIDVDVELDVEAKLRNNMYISGKIIIEEIPDALFVEAPSNTIEEGISPFYRLSKDGAHLDLVKVDTGLLSAGMVHVRSGLVAGDKIAASDVGKFNGALRVALH